MSNHCPMSKTNIETVALDLATLVMIMEYLATNDLLAVMRTCHMLYTAGIQTLVRKSHYVDTDTLPSYRTFMFSHAPASFKAFQELEVEYWTFGDEPTAPLTDILSRGDTHLRQLYLTSDEMPEEIARAIASLTHLKELAVTNDIDERIVYILSNLQSPLTELSTSFQDDHEYPILPLFSKVRDTLETLALGCTTFHGADICFSKLTLLDLETRNLVPMSVLMPIFPNLQELRLEFHSSDAEEQQLLRSQNIAFQQAGHKWTSLRRLQGDIMSLFVLALLQDLDGLTISSYYERFDHQDLHMLQSILSETHPKSLKELSLDVGAETLQTILLSAGLERIVDLSLKLSFDSAAHMEDMLVTLLTALAQLSSHIQHLSLLFFDPYPSDYRSRRPAHEVRHGSSKRPSHKTEVLRVFEGFEMATFAGCVKDALPLLEKLSLHIEQQGNAYLPGNTERWVSFTVEYDVERVAVRTAVQASDEALRDIIKASPTRTVYFSSPPRAGDTTMSVQNA